MRLRHGVPPPWRWHTMPKTHRPKPLPMPPTPHSWPPKPPRMPWPCPMPLPSTHALHAPNRRTHPSWMVHDEPSAPNPGVSLMATQGQKQGAVLGGQQLSLRGEQVVQARARPRGLSWNFRAALPVNLRQSPPLIGAAVPTELCACMPSHRPRPRRNLRSIPACMRMRVVGFASADPIGDLSGEAHEHATAAHASRRQ